LSREIYGILVKRRSCCREKGAVKNAVVKMHRQYNGSEGISSKDEEIKYMRSRKMTSSRMTVNMYMEGDATSYEPTKIRRI
jgi:hypothetical protein